MTILNQLGINSTAPIAFVIFTTSFFILKILILDPFYLAYEEREKRTKGNEHFAKDLHSKAKEIHNTYDLKIRDLNAEIHSIFDHERTEANRAYQKAIADARAAADKLVEGTRVSISAEIKKAKEQLKLEAPGVALAITKKMLN